MVLSHLILNDMIKVRLQLPWCCCIHASTPFSIALLPGIVWVQVKGQISEVAMRLEDEDQRIKDLTGLFFHELAKRGKRH